MIQVDEGGHMNSQDVAAVIHSMQHHFADESSCHENAIFLWTQSIVAMTYIGDKLGKLTAQSALAALSKHILTEETAPPRVVAQICHGETDPGRLFGVFVDTMDHFEAVRKTARSWARGVCVIDGSLPMTWKSVPVESWQLAVNSTA
ncbi:hypothetical protein CDD80_5893 [Ophiocordyceps camponoti-rufipedis]|uniref:Uncharacterized protein n=1 Tax=Ophiocordyceps camponoti-rufipedis TaxID=2004952 RepID=A0A2C5YSK2_9HYPO|nr:hypothetical protein CDD80_5893 [Ophiocordyceps camponoti-rufipedis]